METKFCPLTTVRERPVSHVYLQPLSFLCNLSLLLFQQGLHAPHLLLLPLQPARGGTRMELAPGKKKT